MNNIIGMNGSPLNTCEATAPKTTVPTYEVDFSDGDNRRVTGFLTFTTDFVGFVGEDGWPFLMISSDTIDTVERVDEETGEEM